MASFVHLCKHPDAAVIVCLVLSVALGSQLLRAFEAGSVARGNEAPPLDSFSSSALALAVLKGDAHRLEMNYSQTREETTATCN